MKHKTAWRLFAKALGEKPSKCDRESDRIAYIRTFIFTTYLITNAFIVAGVCKHWNDEPVEIFIEGAPNAIPSTISAPKEEGLFKANSIISYH
jgi:hypothetical protein